MFNLNNNWILLSRYIIFLLFHHSLFLFRYFVVVPFYSSRYYNNITRPNSRYLIIHHIMIMASCKINSTHVLNVHYIRYLIPWTWPLQRKLLNIYRGQKIWNAENNVGVYDVQTFINTIELKWLLLMTALHIMD